MVMRNRSEATPASKPNPGSVLAGERGCTCAVIDNHYGKGIGGNGNRFGWYMREDCPLHGNDVPGAAPNCEASGPELGWRSSAGPRGHSEDFSLSDFMESQTVEFSKILDGYHTIPDRKFRCPKCNMLTGDPPPAHERAHHGCGVSFLAKGNRLQVWKTVK